jgi:hypothetical protein
MKFRSWINGGCLFAVASFLIGCSSKEAVIQVSGEDPYAHPEFASVSRAPAALLSKSSSSKHSDEESGIPDSFLCKDETGKEKVLVCHKGEKTLCLPKEALFGHLGRDDYREEDHDRDHEDEDCEDDDDSYDDSEDDHDSYDDKKYSKHHKSNDYKEYSKHHKSKKKCEKHRDHLGPCTGGGGSGSSTSGSGSGSGSSGSGSSSSGSGSNSSGVAL